MKRASRYESVTDISGALKTMAVELSVPVLALAPLSRKSDSCGRLSLRPVFSRFNCARASTGTPSSTARVFNWPEMSVTAS